MINWLTSATKKRMIHEIRRIMYAHPRYREDSENVQNKFAWNERPQRGVIVNGTSADRVRLAADNFVGRLSSFVMLTPYGDGPNTTVEWVRENFNVLEGVSPDRSVFPSPPGAYIFEVTKLPDDALGIPGEFILDPTLDVVNEYLLTFASTARVEAQLQRQNIYPGALRLWLDGRQPLIPGVDFVADYETGEISFLKDPPPGAVVRADYRYKPGRTGPYEFSRDKFDISAIPGAVVAFGDRAQLGDKFAVVVTGERADAADVYGGKFELSFDLIAFSKDAEDREKLSDYLVHEIMNRQNPLGYEGLEILDVSPGGENEDVYNQETDEYFYESSIALRMRVDWAVHIPLPIANWRIETTSRAEEQRSGFLDGSYSSDLISVVTPLEALGAYASIGKGLTYERIHG